MIEYYVVIYNLQAWELFNYIEQSWGCKVKQHSWAVLPVQYYYNYA
jgi:hypothetical protein